MEYPIYLHINYFENNYTLEEAFAHTAELGCPGLEVRDRDRSGALPLEAYLNLTAELARKYRLGLVYGCRVDTTHEDPARREASTAHFHRVLAHSLANGWLLLNVFTGMISRPGLTYSRAGSAIATPEEWDAATRMLVEAAEAYPLLQLAVETHNGYLHDLPKPTARLMERVAQPNVGVNLDYINIHVNRRGGSWSDAFCTLADHVRYVHLKNVCIPPGSAEGQFRRCLLAKGEVDILRQVGDLLAAGYKAPFCLENTMEADKLPVAKADLCYLAQCLAAVAAFPAATV